MILDINKQRVEDDYIELFILETDSGNSYFTNYHTSLWFADRDSPYVRREYTPLPIEFSGFEHRSEGAYARPQVSFANVLRTLPQITNPDNLIGKKITRRKSLDKYLPTQSSGQGPAPTELPQQIFYIDRITEENPLTITFELTTAFDLEGITVPNRFILANVCTWLYQGNAEDLPGGTTPLGACTWRQDNTFNADTGFTIAYDSANRVLLDNSYASFATTMPTSGSLSANHLYSKAITLNYADGSGTNATNEYFQALGAFDASPFDAVNFRRVRMYTTWSAATNYKIYREGRIYNPCVKTTNNKIWVAVADNTNVTPGSDDNVWERIDICGKKLSSCAARYRVVKYTGQTSVVIPSATEENNEEVLPYGGFPAAKRYNR